MRTVSYTHLDVYKRQEWFCAVISTPDRTLSDGREAPEFVKNNRKPAADEHNIIVTDKEQMMKLYEKMRSAEMGSAALNSQNAGEQVYWLTLCSFEDSPESMDRYFCGYIAASDLPEGIAAPK